MSRFWFLVLLLLALLLLCPSPLPAGGCGYGYSYSYPTYSSYSYPSYSYPSYPTYPTVIEKVKYVEKPVPVYVAQYAPLLVTVPSYSIGYSPPNPQVQTTLQAPVQAPAPQPPVQTPAPQPAPQPPVQAPAPQAPPCEAKLQECQTRLARMEAQMSLLLERRTQAAPTYAAPQPPAYPPATEAEATPPRQAPQPAPAPAYPPAHPQTPAPQAAPPPMSGAAQVLGAKCAMCHSQQTANQWGGKLVLVHQVGQQTMLAELRPQDWSSILDTVATGRMPRKPAQMSQTDFDRHLKLQDAEITAIMAEARRYLARKPS
jgi:hypothetical protein